MTTEALRTVKDRLSEYADRVEREHERVVVTRNGRPAAVLISTEDLESLEETLDIFSDPDTMAGLREGDAAVARGDTVRGIDVTPRLRQKRQQPRANRCRRQRFSRARVGTTPLSLCQSSRALLARRVRTAECSGGVAGPNAALYRPWHPLPPTNKNTLAILAVRQAGLDVLEPLLVGPTSLTFARDDSVAAAKALSTASRANPLLVLKGGALGTNVLSIDDVKALAELPSREELLAMFAGALQAPLVKTAGLLQALPRNFAYGLSALIESREAA